ncbi:MAG: alkaline phosphatase family protein [Mycoplasmoidaceae bacterium]|nr:alkaline phosphatase family protein [Mycoplasmoidaceae bacterium]
MVQYDGIDSDIVIYPPQEIVNPLGKVLSDNNLKQLRIAETEKYAHVTFFFDGGKELNLPGEDKILVPSPKDVPTYDLKPEMSANEVTAKLLENMNKYDVIICNYANPDMVGHTGKIEPTIKAIETVDHCLGQVLAKANEIGMTLFVTADHGNCERMLDENGKAVTSHSTAPVFFISTDKKLRLHDGALNNIAPTILKYLEIDPPKEIDQKPLY